jgi:O-methyltransferase
MREELSLWSRHLSPAGDAFDPAYHEKPRSEILPLIDWRPARVLDIGCGGGATGRLLARHFPGCELLGVERDAGAAAAARPHYSQVVHADLDRVELLELGLDLARVDTVLLLDVLEHLVNPWRLLESLRRGLPERARLVASLPNIANLEALHALASGRWPYARDGLFDITHVRFFTSAGIRELFENTGYTVHRMAPTPHPASRLPGPIGIGPDHVETDAVVVKGLSAQSAADLFAQQQLVVAGLVPDTAAPHIEAGAVPELALAPSTLQSLREAYLELVRRSVLGLVQEDPGLASQGLRKPFDAEAREQGLDWPATAQSMIGHRRMLNVQTLAEQVIHERVPGDFIETGVWRGGACIMMRAVLRAHGVLDRRVWVADSFAGLPQPSPERYPLDAGDTHFRMPELAISMTEVQRNFERYGLLDDRVCFLRGWFKDTLPTAPTGPLALMRLDGDMYESTIDALDALFHRLSPGGFVIIDDYGYVESCRAAVDDFRARHGIVDPVQTIDRFGVYWRNVQPHAFRSTPWQASPAEPLAAATWERRSRPVVSAARPRLKVANPTFHREQAKLVLKGHHIETAPADFLLANGDLRLVGWVVGREADALWVSLVRDGERLGTVAVSHARPDVARVHAGADFSGFALHVPARYLGAGERFEVSVALAGGTSVVVATLDLVAE